LAPSGGSKISTRVKSLAFASASVVWMKPDTQHHYRELVLRAVAHIQATLDETLDGSALGKRARLAPLHFHRIFLGLVGETPLEMHRRLRLERAAWALVQTERPVTRLAFEAGYETHESFTRAFAAAFGASPTEFRARTRANPASWATATASALAAPSGVHFTPDASSAPIPIQREEPAMNVSVQHLLEKFVIAAAHRGPYNTISAAFARLDAALKQGGVSSEACLELVALYYDDAELVPAAQLSADAGVVVRDGTAVPAGLHLVSIAAGDYATTLHEGPYERLGDAWARFMGGWLVSSGRTLAAGPSYERYLNTPMNAAPHELRTELFLPLADAGSAEA
jgi:AraC family transcriptional regulator